jgi:hypothetical protein
VDRRASTDRRDLYNGFGDTLARAFEVVFTPLLFGLLGWWIDGRTHTRPLFALVFGVFTAVYTLWKLSKGYMTRMEAEEQKVVPRARRNG